MDRVLIANRGEIAVRIIRTCKKLGIDTVAIYSEADKDAYHTKLADHSVCIGAAKAEKSYLNIPAIMAVAKSYKIDAIHPGIGFLSESAKFQEACEAEGIVFIGPSAETMELLGNKALARELMLKNGIPLPPGSNGAVESYEEAKALADDIGYPVILKAAFGGGGGGIRIVTDPEDFHKLFNIVKHEAKTSFGSDSVYLEKYLTNTRHIEVQLIADFEGKVLHLGTRECSMQRNNQKIIEEAPAPFIDDALRKEIQDCAVKIAEIANYKNAGTVEFLLTEDNKFYFMEMNTRIQVEHTVTEAIYGIDLIKCQIQVALNHKLTLEQSQLISRGHAIECRINAEDPSNKFAASPGTIKKMQTAGGNGVRIDSGYIQGDKISPFYDSLVMKIIGSGSNRDEAINTCVNAIYETEIEGIKTNCDFANSILTHNDFIKGKFNTKWIETILCKQLFDN